MAFYNSNFLTFLPPVQAENSELCEGARHRQVKKMWKFQKSFGCLFLLCGVCLTECRVLKFVVAVSRLSLFHVYMIDNNAVWTQHYNFILSCYNSVTTCKVFVQHYWQDLFVECFNIIRLHKSDITAHCCWLHCIFLLSEHYYIYTFMSQGITLSLNSNSVKHISPRHCSFVHKPLCISFFYTMVQWYNKKENLRI